jgi:hypothetical protein
MTTPKTFALVVSRYALPHPDSNDCAADLLNAFAASQKLDVFTNHQKRHLFFGLMSVFKKEYTIMAVMITIQATGSFASPLGIRNLLQCVHGMRLCLPCLTFWKATSKRAGSKLSTNHSSGWYGCLSVHSLHPLHTSGTFLLP